MTPATLARLIALRNAGHMAAVVTSLADGRQFLLPDAAPQPPIPPALRDAADQAMASQRHQIVSFDDQDWFVQIHAPPLRLLIVGAVHIGQSLADMARLAGLSVTVIDPRRGFVTAERFPAVALRAEWPDCALAALAPDHRTAVVVLSHDPKIDDPALDAALKTPCFYIGALGSRRSHAARLDRLRQLGHEATMLDRIRGPVGLGIGAMTPAEISVSILAEIIAVLRGAPIAHRTLAA